MTEVFKTNVRTPYAAKQIINDLGVTLPGCDISFDLEDCDKVLRVQSRDGLIIDIEAIHKIVNSYGFNIAVLNE